MASISGTVTIAGDPDDWIACAFDSGTHAFAGVAAVSGGAYEITGLTAGKAYVVSCRPKTGGTWQADDGLVQSGDVVIPTDPASDPYIFKATDVTFGDLLWDDVVLSMRFEGENNSTTFTDDKSHTATAQGNAIISTAGYKYGASSGYFDGTTDGVTLADSADWDIGNDDDFTIECWFNCASYASTRVLLCLISAANWRLYVTTAGKLAWFQTNASLTGGTTISTGTWYHAAVCRSSGTVRLFLDGALEAEDTSAAASVAPSAIEVGAIDTAESSSWSGYIDDLRFTKAARYTEAFTPPTVESPTSLSVPTGGTEPTWPTTPGNTVVDGGVTWTNMGQFVQPLMQGPLIAA